MQSAARWFVEFILEPFAPLKGKLREGLTMTLGFKYEALHTLVQRAPLKNHVMLTPSAQLRACSGRHLAVWRCMPLQNTMRWFAPLTMTLIFQRRGNALIGAMRCMSLQNAMRWFAPLTMTLIFYGRGNAFISVMRCIVH
jgi:hypothetical protein